MSGESRRPGPREIQGVCKVPYKVADAEPLSIMWRGWDYLIGMAEDDGDWYFNGPFGPWEDVGSLLLHGLSTRVARDESTLSPDYRMAVVEVTGRWSDADGMPVGFVGLDRPAE